MQVRLQSPLRWATKADAAELAELVNMAGEGLPLYLWAQMTTPGQSAWDVGRSRACREDGAFSYRNAIVREASGSAVAALVGYPLHEPESRDYADLPAMFVPLQQLEDSVPGTWYVNVLATHPDYRGRGYGAQLLGIAEDLAGAADCSGLSLIVSDANVGARRLYERLGFREIATRPMVKEHWEHGGETWQLMLREFVT